MIYKKSQLNVPSTPAASGTGRSVNKSENWSGPISSIDGENEGYSLLVVGVPQCHSRGDCSGEHCANCIHLPRLSGGPASQFFGEASRAFPQHGWRSAYSLRETLSPTQDQGQHLRPLHTHPTTHTHQVH